MTGVQKFLLGSALAATLAPFVGYLAVGLFFMPLWLSMLFISILKGFEGASEVLLLVLLFVGGVAGLFALHNVVSRLYGLPAPAPAPGRVISGIVAGLLSLAGAQYLLELPVFAAAAAAVTLLVIYLDRKFLFGSRVH